MEEATMFKHIALAALAATTFAFPAQAGGFSFADHRCKAQEENQIVCMGGVEDATLAAYVMPGITFEQFVDMNETLVLADVTPETLAPAFRMYVVREDIQLASAQN